MRDQLTAAAVSISLPWLYLAAFVVMLALVPVIDWAEARFRRRQLLGVAYGFFALNLLLFVPAFWAKHKLGVFALGKVSARSSVASGLVCGKHSRSHSGAEWRG